MSKKVAGVEAPTLDCERLAAEFVRVLRGKRSQMGLSKKLGYRSNMVYRWESGESWPTASAFFTRCQRIGLDVRAAFGSMFARTPEWLEKLEPASTRALGEFLEQCRGRTSILEVSAAVQINRYTVSRWLKGTAQPRLPDFFKIVEATSQRLLDLLSHWVDPERLPSARQRWRELERARSLAYEQPWAHAVLRVLQLGAYNARPRGAAWIADRLGLPVQDAENGLHALEAAGQVTRKGRRWVPRAVERLDMGRDAPRSRALKLFWTKVAAERLAADGPGMFGYSLFEVSREDLVKLRGIQLDYVRAMQHVIANSRGTDRVGLYCAQLLDLSPHDNAFTEWQRPEVPPGASGAGPAQNMP
jgi:transcriptional regulator with XRE-family HTH domain